MWSRIEIFQNDTFEKSPICQYMGQFQASLEKEIDNTSWYLMLFPPIERETYRTERLKILMFNSKMN